ncbi:DUF3667 domain-containing protein [Rufibacter sp. LB8]|uniref:DUF3667 domain-containing protein n=1 Tax=Rufibacter sp. LB8 TaxID=2777781 RepID=UPI00178C1B9C|nr:DUF3667 domain-containing protein [Rufibacter sp. LB8]
MVQETILQDTLLQDVALPKKADTPAAHPEHCANCQEMKHGHFCSSCGAETVNPHHELSFKHFLGHSLHEVTHIENSKVGKTLWALLFKPGQLTLDYFAGKKIRYLSPLRIFLLIFALSVFAYSFSETNRLYDVELINKMDTTGAFNAQLDRLAADHKVERPVLVQQMNQTWQRYVSWSQFSYVLVMGLMLKLVYQKRYFVEHVIFSFHFISFSLLFAVLLWPAYYLVGIGASTANSLLSLVNVVIAGGYLVFALKRMYGQSWKRTGAKVFLLLLGYYTTSSLVYLVAMVFAIASAK